MVEIYLTPRSAPGVPPIVIEDPGQALNLIEALVDDREEILMVVIGPDGFLVGIVSFGGMTLVELVSDPEPMIRLLHLLGAERLVVGVSLGSTTRRGGDAVVELAALEDRELRDQLEARLGEAGIAVEGWAHLDTRLLAGGREPGRCRRRCGDLFGGPGLV